jgi:ABC-type antimicrobial peptide transport system permease subunit
MKVGRIPLVSIVLLVISLISFTSKYFFPSAHLSLKPYFDGALVGAMLVLGLYYANIYVTAWMNNRKEARSVQE